MGSTRGRTRTLEAARRVAYVWKALRPAVRGNIQLLDATLAAEINLLLAAVEAPAEPEVHRTNVRTITSRGRAENGWQPEREYVWSCSCRPGVESGDMGGSPWAKQAADKHRDDPTLFPGWIS